MASLALPNAAGEEGPGKEPREAEEKIEFSINGEPITQKFIMEGLLSVNQCAPEVCPTDLGFGWEVRRNRLVELIPLRQFLAREKVQIGPQEIEDRLEVLKSLPNPFEKQPPKSLQQGMVRDCMPWEDVRLLILVDLGLKKWAELAWRKNWPDEAAWREHCQKSAEDFRARFGKFSRISFSLSRWPKGANNEEEALAILEKEARAAKAELDGKARFEEVAKRLAERKELPALSLGSKVLPFTFLGARHVAALSGLAEGGISEPLPTSFSWEVVLREKVSEEEVGNVLKAEFLVKAQADCRAQVAKESVLKKVDWKDQEGLQQLSGR